MPVFLFSSIISEGDVALDGSEVIRTIYQYLFMSKRITNPIVKTTTIVVVLRLIKVRTYTRVRFGKKEKVRSHWRRLRGVCTETCVTVSK